MGAAKFGSEGILAPVSASSAAAAPQKSAFRQARSVLHGREEPVHMESGRRPTIYQEAIH